MDPFPRPGKASGAYAYAWTGRDSSGAVLPEGKYKIVQSLNDGYTTKAVTSYVQLSRKHLIWHSAAVIKKGSAISSRARSRSPASVRR